MSESGTTPPPAAPLHSDESVRPNKLKRKQMSPSSDIWEQYKRMKDDPNKAICKYCSDVLSCHLKKNGASSLVSHAKWCTQNSDSNETQCFDRPDPDDPSRTTLFRWKYNAREARTALARLIIEDPLVFSQHRGFSGFTSKICTRFSVPPRKTVCKDVLCVYEDEKAKVKSFFQESHQRVSLSVRTWTSSRLQKYMHLTAHYIDSKWKLNHKILNFCLLDNHKGEDMAKALDSCLLDWGIENVTTITMEDASSNDMAIEYIRTALKNRGASILQGRYLHMRCSAHIVNLVVQDCLEAISPSVSRIRDAVKYVKSSTSRMSAFNKCVQYSKVDSSELLCLDVCTRWNSTYVMLDRAERFEEAFESFLLKDPDYKTELGEGNGVPQHTDWMHARKFTKFLKHLYRLTCSVSETEDVYSHMLFRHVAGINQRLIGFCDGDDNTFKPVAIKLKEKYIKYWGDPEEMNMLIFVAAILDPRNKQSEHLKVPVLLTYGETRGEQVLKKANETLHSLFEEYKCMYEQVGSQGDGSETQPSCSRRSKVNYLFYLWQEKERKAAAAAAAADGRTELERYISEEVVCDDDDFDILLWWKYRRHLFPILSRMARDILAIHMSTVSCESAFSTGGCVLDDFRSSLPPLVVQSLICAQDCVRQPSNGAKS
ncbi:zinc finger BED domain-containing protein RICESLEEPER 2 [Lolium perenne]|uniref:zinc finger BED domain-containing protein RICESLEEPER 2 n=1 Tax=Lolium perenne TaxID=4522 RepID=UPI0021F50BFF|nr:zinc finger BED domain-containing protein RICESLEEPER 2-like [Lolium perenne]